MSRFLCFLITAAFVVAADPQPPLERKIEHLRFEKTPIASAARALGRACDTMIAAEPDVTGDVNLEIRDITLGDALAALTAPRGLYFETAPGGLIVRRLKTVLYLIDYPQLTRSGSGSASITLGGANHGQNATAGVASTLAQLPNTTANAGSSDATQVSISQENQNTFWTTLETELRAMLKDGDVLVLNRFAGVAQITAPLPRHEVIRGFLALVTRRITQQVEIEARLVEVTLREERKLGVDWELATVGLRGSTVEAAAPLEVPGVGGTVLGASTFTANLGFGQATAVIHALKQQGDVRTVAQPRLRTLNNQTAFIKVGEDRPFFRLQQATSFQQPGANLPFNQTQEQFSVTTITIGTILAVTPQIDERGVITLDVLPAITRLQAIVTSPDGRQTAPLTDVKQASTIVRLRDGETAVIGGLISEEGGESVRAVPVLGRVPLVGWAFRSQAALKSRSELVIFLTPRLVR